VVFTLSECSIVVAAGNVSNSVTYHSVHKTDYLSVFMIVLMIYI
jgi:hypothetical protein